MTRLLVDLQSHQSGAPAITQVEGTPVAGAAGNTPINGKYVLPILDGVELAIDDSSYVLDGAGNVDGGDVSSLVAAHVLARFPMFGTIYFNPLLTDDHVGELDFSATFKILDLAAPFGPSPPEDPLYFPCRLQTGREPIGPGQTLDPGQMPTHTAILPLNEAADPPRPGMLISNTLNIGPYTLDSHGAQVGTDEFMLHWKLYSFTISQDEAADHGARAGENNPAIRYVQEVDQEPSGFRAYISPDDGENWCEVGLLDPVAFCDKTKAIRVAFRNDSTEKFYIASFAVLF